MRALVFADSHYNLEYLDKMIKEYNPERVYGLGDYGVSELELDLRRVIGVRGNDPFDPDSYGYDYLDEIDGFRILFTHGHKYSVKYDRFRLKMRVLEKNIDICFYGHTHVASIEEDSGKYFINPGSISIPSYPNFPTLALMDSKPNELNIKIIDAELNEVYKEITIKK